MTFRILLILSSSLFVIASCVNHDLNSGKYNCEKSKLTLVLDSVVSATRCGVADGAIYISANDGAEPYTFSLNDQPPQSLNYFTALASGIYSLTVTDRNGCKRQLDNLVVLADDFKFSASVTEDSQCLGGNGTITIQVQEGSGPFRYKLGSNDFSNDTIFKELAEGQYNVVIQDASSCTIQLNITVPHGNTNVKWSNDILPILKKSCAINGCHDGKTRSDYRLYENVKKDLQQIKSTTKNKTMPFDGTPLPQNQIDIIGCWVDDGGMEN